MMNMDKVVHFEIPYDDLERAKIFYSEIFNWRIQTIPEMNYNIIHTVAVDDKQMPLKSGAINEGMYKRDENSSQTPVLVIDVQSIEETLNKVKKKGGIIFREKIAVEDMGFYAQVKDSEGNIIGL